MKRAWTRIGVLAAAAGLVVAVSSSSADARPNDWWLHVNHPASTTQQLASTTSQ